MGNSQKPPATAPPADNSGIDLSSVPESQAKTLEDTSPEYQITRILQEAKILTGEDYQDQLSQSLPTCDANKQEDQEAGSFVNLMLSLQNGTYQGTDPSGDIGLVIRQLLACQREANPSLIKKIFSFLSGDQGKMKRKLLLSVNIVIKCLALWKVFADSPGFDGDQMRKFVADSLAAGKLQTPPDFMKTAIANAQKWLGDMTEVSSDFSPEGANAPVMLALNDTAMSEVIEANENGSLPPQKAKDSDQIYPITFARKDDIKTLVEQFLTSGEVKPIE